MNPYPFLSGLLAAAIGLGVVTAGEPAGPLPGEQTERPLTGLAERCQKMLAMQIAVYDGTKQLHQAIEAAPDKKPRPKDKEIAVQMSLKQKAIIVEASAVLDMLNADGLAVAFVEVFEDLRGAMKRVQARLEKGDVGPDTQTVEKEIIDTLKELVEAAKPSRWR